MSRSLKVLLVEDSPHDAELQVRRLSRAGFEVDATRVETAHDFRASLHPKYDVILCDYAMPQFSGLDALAILRESMLEIPLILVSGTVGEEVAVEAMQQGAVDYLLKDRLERLGSAVRRALEQRQLREQNRRAVEALELSERRFRQLTEHIEEVFWIRDASSERLLYVSPAFEPIWGRSAPDAADLEHWPIAVHPDDRRESSSEARRPFTNSEQEYRIIRPDGTTRMIHDRAFVVRNEAGEPEHIVGVANDVTLARQLEEQVRHSQKMEAIGLLAGGIAHDFNNVMSIVLAGSSLLLEYDTSEPIRAGLEEIQLAAERAATLTRQLLLFSRRQTMQAGYVELNELVRGITRLLRRVVREDIALELDLTEQRLPLHADRGMIEQIIMNLAVNARDAMPKGGSLRISTGAVVRDQIPKDALGELQRDSSYSLLQVRDTGSGIAPELQRRIFEPFFTTKPANKGTGLGLATLYTIVQRHHGAVAVSSEPGRGSTFSVYLPSAVRALSEPAQTIDERTPAIGNGETILFVEDDETLRDLTSRVLIRHGYRVLSAADGASALQLWRAHRAEIALLVTDLVMPGGVTGHEVADQLKREESDLKVIYATGYSEELAGKALAPCERLLPKPYSPARLIDLIRACLVA